MERKVVWTERASGDIEAIVRLSRDETRTPQVASVWALRNGSRSFNKTPTPVPFWMNSVQVVGESLFSVDGRSFMQSETTQSSLGASGRQLWVRPIWKLCYDEELRRRLHLAWQAQQKRESGNGDSEGRVS